ncbi:MAG: PilZ domain-containing protein [Pseudomonadota bacterium]
MQTRAHERLPANQRVDVRYTDRDQLYQAYLTDISRGGLFVCTDQSHALRDPIEVNIEVEGSGILVLQGEVVHVVTAEQARAFNGQAGVGVQFHDLDGERKELLEEFLDGLRERLDRVLQKAPFDTTLLDQVEQASRKNDLFAVVGLDVHADDVQIAVALEVRQRTLGELWSRPDVTGELKDRIARAQAVVERSAAVLSDPTRRYYFVFRSGLLSTEKLVEALQGVPDVAEEIARQWERANPQPGQTGRRLAELALKAFARGDVVGARKSAQLALQQNPFLFELRRELKRRGG